VRQALATSRTDLRVYDRWLAGDNPLVLRVALPGLQPELVDTPDGRVWAQVVLHPSGRRLVLPLPMALEVEQASVALTVPAQSLYRLTQALTDRAAALSDEVVAKTQASPSMLKRLWLRRPELSAAATGSIKSAGVSPQVAPAEVVLR